MNKEIFFVTGNSGKFETAKEYLKIHAPSINLKQYNINFIEEQTLDQLAIVKKKAFDAYLLLQKPVLVDDAGLYFDAYKNFPGTMTKFILQSLGYDGVFKLLKTNNKALYQVYMAYKENETTTHIFKGIQNGILKQSQATAPDGLPWDALFIPNGSSKTYTDLYNEKSHLNEQLISRIIALQQLTSLINAK